MGLLFVCGYVYAQIQERVGVVESTVNVFPGSLSSNGWQNTETLLVQNVTGDALFQDFNTLNSAYLPENVRGDVTRTVRIDGADSDVPADGDTSASATEPTETGATTSALLAAPTSPTEEAAEDVREPEEQPVLETGTSTTETLSDENTFTSPTTTTPAAGTTPAPTSTSTAGDIPDLDTTTTTTTSASTPVNASVEAPPAPNATSSATTTVMQRLQNSFQFAFTTATQLLPFVNEVATTATPSEVESIPEATDTTEAADGDEASSAADTQTAVDTTIAEVADAQAGSPVTTTEIEMAVVASGTAPDVDETESTSPTTTATGTAPTATSSASPQTTTTEPRATDQTETEPDDTTPTSAPDTPASTAEVEATVPAYGVTLSDFWLPVFADDDTQITGAQLRVSLAAQKKWTRLDRPASIQVSYSLTGGATWETAGAVLLEEEVSNSLNGDYFLFALPFIQDAESLRELQVRIAYEGERETIEEIYLESAWLEIFTRSGTPEPVDPLAHFNDNFQDAVLNGDTLVLPSGEVITFDFTDENSDENLIIKSDDVNYEGLTKATMYFNVTNESDRSDEFEVKTYFPAGGLGEVTSLEVWQQNKPREVVIPEFRPYVYHCDAGWSIGSAQVTTTSDESADTTINTATAPTTPVMPVATGTVSTPSTVPQPTATDTVPVVAPATTSTTTVSQALTTALPFAQAVATGTATTGSAIAEETDLQYTCVATEVVRSCDYLAGAGSECWVENERVAEHVKTAYRSGWEQEEFATTSEKTDTSRAARLGGLLGVGPAVKPVPEEFEARTETPDRFSIQPGETRYFKMEIAFPPFSNGEFWIEAIGSRAYGLLDPFWNSRWQYKLPISIDNTAASATSTEQQVFLELTASSSADFWSNVNSDGSDVRFIREEGGNETTWFDQTYAQRQQIPITIGANRPENGYLDYTVRTTIDTATLIGNGDMLSSCDDLRVVYKDSVLGTEIDRVVSDCNTATTSVIFALQADHATSTTVNDYYLYFDNPAPTAPLENTDNVYLWYDDVSSDRLSEYTNDRGDNWHANGTGASTAYNVAGYYTFDTGDNVNESIRVPNTTLSERDVYFEAEVFIDTCYPNNIAFGAYARYLSEASYYNAVRAEAGLTCSGDGGYAYDGDIIEGATGAVVVDGTNPGDVTDNQWRKIAIGAWGINDTNLYYWDIDDASTEPAPGFIDAVVHASGTDATDIESAGEVGLQYSQSGGRVRNLIARRYVEPEPNITPEAAETLDPTTYVELDYWIQHFDSTAEEADIWVQVDELAPGASSTIFMYYGNSGATSASDEVAPFTYSTTTPIYYVVDDDGRTDQISIVSLVDNNEVSLDGGTPVSLDEGERTTFGSGTFTATSVISVLGPISGTVTSNSNDGSETIVPISFATTTFLIPQNRGNETVFVLSPFASTSASTFIGNSGTADQTVSIATGTVTTFTSNPGGSDGLVIDATDPVLVMHQSSNSDGLVPVPPSLRDLYGFDSNSALLSSLTADPDPTVFCSVGSGGTASGIGRGERVDYGGCAGGNQNNGAALRVTGQLYPMAGVQQADADGTDATFYWPQTEFGTRYGLSNDMQYIAVICAPRYGSVDLELRNTTGTAIETATCNPGTGTPGTAYFGDTANGLEYIGGHEVVSTNGAPFYVVYEDISSHSDGDEKNVLGPVQGRKFGADAFAYSFGAQEINQAARWEQLSYRWYENEDAEPPTTGWIGAEGAEVAEGEAITSAGAVDSSDTLRLRMNIEAGNATGTINSTDFALQYAAVDTCSAALDTDWRTVGEIGSTTPAFVGAANASLTDGDTLSTSTLASTTLLGTYEEENNSTALGLEVPIGDVLEFDWVISPENPQFNTEYCFRMIRGAGTPLFTYTSYPELLTSGPPLAPTLLSPFADEHEPDPDTVFEFFATDISGDDMDFQVQIDDNLDFGSTVVDRTSQANPLDFVNLTDGSDKRPFNAGDRMQFFSPTTLSASTTYWWRVRAIDPGGSNVYGDWSTPQAFTINQSQSIDEWYQTTGEQFAQNALVNVATSSGAATASTAGSMTSTAIDFDDATVGNAWGTFDFAITGNATVTLEYFTGSGWSAVPDGDLPDNSTGFVTGSGPINILPLNTETYNELRLVAELDSGASLTNWEVTWGLRVETPTLTEPFDHELEPDGTPTLVFTTSDPQDDDLFYELSYSTTSSFTSSTTVNSSTSVDFLNQTDGGNFHPFRSGDTIGYTFPSALSTSTTYWWRVRAKDPAGGDAFSPWSEAFAFTIGTTSASTWFQTTAEQFNQNIFDGVEASSTAEAVVVSSQIGEYGTVTVTDNDWTEVTTNLAYNNMVVVASPEWAVTNSNGRTPRVRNKTATTFEIKVDNETLDLTGSTQVDYLVMEAGEWTVDDSGSGVRMIAGTIEDESNVLIQAYQSGYSPGTQVDFSPAFSTAPSVIATIASDNDSSWVKTFTDGCAVVSDAEPVQTDRFCGSLGLSTIDSAIHDPEDIDYIVVEEADTTVSGVAMQSFTEPESGSSPSGSATAVSFPTAFSSTPAITLVQQSGENGGDGGFASKSTSGTNDTSEISVQITEFGPQEGGHTNEAVAIVAFEDSTGTLLRSAGAGSLVGTMTSEPID
ncbi:MAG TPA: DUF2341 domain-containing protein, partial [Candidatus Paceibacterota bacterium]|nr:DUF2341 domain-containing protein [Candidatus Paceibacterota bacterium]